MKIDIWVRTTHKDGTATGYIEEIDIRDLENARFSWTNFNPYITLINGRVLYLACEHGGEIGYTEEIEE
jgi:hypothetical protein